MILRIMKNMEPAPYYGSMFGQDVEPSGTYVIEKDSDRPVNKPWVSGLAVIKNPLTIEVNDNTQISYKYELAKEYKAKGKQLTKKLMALGYDAIITMKDGESNEIILFPNCDFMLNSLNENKFLIKSLLRIKLNENRELGKPLSLQMNTPYITIYRAAPIEASEFFDKDYVTLSKKFAIEHAENNHVYHDEPFHVIKTLVSTNDVFDASNPGEYFYSGPNKKAIEIYVSKGPENYEGYDELFENEYTGWHKPPSKDNGHPMYDISNYYDDDLYGPNGARYYGHGGSATQMDNTAISILRTAKGNPEQPIKIYRAIPKKIKNPQINNGDWVTISLEHAKNHGYQQFDKNYIILDKIVKAKDLFTDGGSIHEWGYDPN